MAFGLQKGESVQKGLRRTLKRELQGALECLGSFPLTDKAVHEARTHIKKCRAVLRFVRKDVRGVSAGVERTLRDSARMLSRLRDADAMVATASGLCQRHGGTLTTAACGLVRDRLTAHEQRTKEADRRAVRLALGKLRSIEGSARRLRLKTSGSAVLRRGVKRAYEKAHRDMHRAIDGRYPSSFHEWRKRVKALWYDLRLIAKRVPDFGQQLATLHRLQRELGREHNLQVLRSYLMRSRSPRSRRMIARLTALADERQQRLRRSALALGAQIFALTPKQFASRGFRSR